MNLIEEKGISLSTQAFLVLCRLFDNCYDELQNQDQMKQVVEETANVLLTGVQFLQEQSSPPKTVELLLSFQQVFFLRKLIMMHHSLVQDAQHEQTRGWLDECLTALQQ